MERPTRTHRSSRDIERFNRSFIKSFTPLLSLCQLDKQEQHEVVMGHSEHPKVECALPSAHLHERSAS
jgi:hypothetical protein